MGKRGKGGSETSRGAGQSGGDKTRKGAGQAGGDANRQEAAQDSGKRSLEETVQKVADSLERAKLGEYVELMSRPGRLIYLNLLGGLFRGMGMAVGFTLLGALVIYVLTRNFVSKLPVVGDFLGELVWIIQQYLRGKS